MDMKQIRKYTVSAFALLGILSLFLPVKGAETMIGLLSRWSSHPGGSGKMMIVLSCLMLLLSAVIVIWNCYNEQQKRNLIFAVLAGVCVFGMFAIYMLDSLKSRPRIGGIAYGVCMILSAAAAVLNQGKQKQTVSETVRATEPEPEAADEPDEAEPLPEPESKAPQELPKGKLKIMFAPFYGAEIELEHMKPLTIGRDASKCNFVVDEEGISRRHCTITYNMVNHSYILQDISTNGTYLESGQRIPPNFAMEVPEGTQFYIAKRNFSFVLGE